MTSGKSPSPTGGQADRLPVFEAALDHVRAAGHELDVAALTPQRSTATPLPKRRPATSTLPIVDPAPERKSA